MLASLRIFSVLRLRVGGMKTSSDVKLWSNGGSSCLELFCPELLHQYFDRCVVLSPR